MNRVIISRKSICIVRKLLEKINLKSAVRKMLTLCDVNNDELCLYILEEFHNTR